MMSVLLRHRETRRLSIQYLAWCVTARWPPGVHPGPNTAPVLFNGEIGRQAVTALTSRQFLPHVGALLEMYSARIECRLSTGGPGSFGVIGAHSRRS